MAKTSDSAISTEETEEYEYLERRPHRWRKQLYIKGRNMTVAHLVYGMRAEGQTPEEAAEDFDLPLAQVKEALAYSERHRDIVEADQDEEKRLLLDAGIVLDPPSVPR